MQKDLINLGEMKLAGLQVRTNNKNEMNPSSAKIEPLVQQYFQQQVSGKIQNRKNPDKTFCAYSNYESDYRGDYDFFIGEQVTSFDNLAEDLITLTIPAQKYARLTTGSGTMPMIAINAWQKIWQMAPRELGGDRRYATDFEIYDERAQDPNNTILDIYIGIK
jgi:predicted transcriptional regulator YdeE